MSSDYGEDEEDEDEIPPLNHDDQNGEDNNGNNDVVLSDKDDQSDKSSKKNNNPQVCIIYNIDGLSQHQLKYCDIKDSLKLSDCCQKYYKPEMFPDQDLYGVEGLKTCLHCCFTFYGNKYYSENENKLEAHEKELLQMYKNKYSQEHKDNPCDRKKAYGRCILCEAKDEIMLKLNKTQYEDTSIQVSIFDVYLIDKSNAQNFILYV